jgi:hypothetical protein
MKQNQNFIKIIILLSFIIFSVNATAQLVAFVGKDANSPDEFSFVALQELPSGTEIYFTSWDWDNTTGNFVNPANEGTLLFTSTAIIAKGVVTQISETAANSFTITGGLGTAAVVGGQSWSVTSADQHYAFTSSNSVNPETNVASNGIYALLNTPQTMSPPGPEIIPLTGTNASPNAIVVSISGQPIAVDYNADRTTATKADLMNPSNYSSGSNITLDLTSFTNASLPVDLQSFEIE